MLVGLRDSESCPSPNWLLFVLHQLRSARCWAHTLHFAVGLATFRPRVPLLAWLSLSIFCRGVFSL